MPLRDTDDLYQRFRAARPSSQRPPLGADVKAGALPRFPAIGMTLPPRQQAAPEPQRLNPSQAQRAQPRTASPTLGAVRRQPATAAPRKRRFHFPRGLITRGRVALVIAVLVVGMGGWFGYKVVSNVQKVFHGSVFSILSTTKLRGEDVGRVNILLAGNSADDPGHDGANLTDSIMMVSIDTQNNSADMISIPRDMWVDIPGYGHAKINEAYVDGQAGNFSAPGYFNGGMGLLQEVVEQNFGLKADYYALVDYSALRDAVNAVGGIDIDIQSEDPRGLYDPSIDYATHGPLVKLSNGVHHLNGEEALDLSRARGDAYGSYGFSLSDFERTQNQREIILALRNKILTAGTLSNPLTLSSLFDTIGQNVQTDFSLSEVRRLYDIGKGINGSNIQSIGLNNFNGKNLLANYTSPNNESALIPAAGIDDYSQIKQAIAQLTSSDPLVREAATVVVLNGTSTVGLAAETEKVLTDQNIDVTAVGDATTPTDHTIIIDTTSNNKPASLAKLKSIFGSTAVPTATNPYAGTYAADFIVVVGSDWNPNAAPSSTTQ